jgi:hypothetical protein
MTEKKIDETDSLHSRVFADVMKTANDSTYVFVPVGDRTPRDAALRALNVASTHPKHQVEPVDLTTVFADTKPNVEYHIEEIQTSMYAKKHTDVENLPVEIKFEIPEFDADADDNDHDIMATVNAKSEKVVPQYVTAKYVHIDSMPIELRSVIRNYLSLIRGDAFRGFEFFQKSIDDLQNVASKLSSDQHEKPAVIPGVGCVDPRQR